MPYEHPTRAQLRAQIAADLQAALPPGADPLLRFSNLGILGNAEADLAFGVYGYLDFIALQAIPFTATGEYLAAWAALKGVTRLAATPATFTATLTGVVGSDIPLGTPLVRGDGFAYATTIDMAVGSGGTATVPIAASTTGSLGNASVGTLLTLGSSVTGLQSSASIAAIVAAGTDNETDAAFRTRMLQVYSAPPQGGSYADYLEWALTVPGVTRAWVLPNGAGSGTVVIYTMFDVSESAFQGFPQGTGGTAALETRGTVATGDLLAVANLIYPLQPVTALIWSEAPVANPVNITLSGLSGASAATKAAITAAVQAVMLREGNVGGAIGVGQTQATGALDLSYINSAIAAVTGTTPFVMTSPTVNIVSPTGQLPVLGTITYI